MCWHGACAAARTHVARARVLIGFTMGLPRPASYAVRSFVAKGAAHRRKRGHGHDALGSALAPCAAAVPARSLELDSALCCSPMPDPRQLARRQVRRLPCIVERDRVNGMSTRLR